MLCNGVDKIAWFSVILVILLYLVVVTTPKNADSYLKHTNNFTTLDSNFESESKTFLETETGVESDSSSWKRNGKERNNSSFPTKGDIFKATSIRPVIDKGGNNPVKFTTLDSDLEGGGDNVQNNQYEAENDSSEENADSNDKSQTDFYSKVEASQPYWEKSENEDIENTKNVTDMYADSELSGEFQQNDDIEATSSSDEDLIKKQANKPSLFSHKKTNKDLKDKQYKNILLKKTKKPCIQKEDSKNEKKINGECIKVKDHIKPKQLLAVKLHSNTRKPGLENYHRINSKQTVQSQFKQNIYHGTDQIPAAIDMAFQRPSLPVITQPRSRPTRVYSRVSHTPTRPTIKPSKTFSKPTQTSQPTQKFSKPTLAFSKPTQTFSKPSKTLSKPTQTFSKPTKMFSKPTNSYTRPTQTVTKPTQSQLLTKPKLIYTRPGNSTLPQPTHWLQRHRSQQVLVKPTRSQSCKSAIDLAFLMEASRSVGHTGLYNYLFLRDFVKKVSLRLIVSPKHIRIGLITFASRPYLHLGLFGGSKITDVLGVLNRPAPRYHYQSSARTGLALDFVHNHLFGCYCGPVSTRKKVVVLITDGSSIDHVYWPAKRLKDAGIQILCIGIGRYFDINQLNIIASSPYTKNVFTGAFSQIHHVINGLVEQICDVSNGTLVPSKHTCPCT